MGERTMSDALASADAGARIATPPRSVDLESKKRAIESPEVNAFIRAGARPETPDAGHATRSGTQPPSPTIQLNTKIPTDLYQRARRAVFENQMSGLQPITLQELISQALSSELRRIGY